MTLRGSLISLAAGTALPLALLLVLVGYVLVEHEKDTFRRGALDRNRAFMTAVDAELHGHIATLNALAASPALQVPDLAAFHREATRFTESQPDWGTIILATPDGQQLVNTAAAPGAPLPKTTEMQSLERVVSTGEPVVGGVTFGPIIRDYFVPIRVPVFRNHRLAYVLTAAVSPPHFGRLIENQKLPAGWVSGLVDPAGFFIARVPPRPHSERASNSFLAAVASAEEGWYRGRTVEGKDTFTAYKRSGFSGWSIGYAVPKEAVFASAYRAAWILSVGIFATLLLAGVFAVWMGRRIATPMHAIADAAKRLSDPDLALPAATRQAPVEEVRAVADAIEQGASAIRERQSLLQREREALRAAALEKERLLAETTKARRRLETMFHTSLIGIITWRVSGALTGANRAFLSSVRYARRDLDSGRLSWRSMTPARYIDIDNAKLEELKKHRFHTPFEKEFIRRDGTLVPVLVVSAFFPDSQEEGISYIVDLDDVKRAERQTRELLAKVTENEHKLREADERKDVYLATLAHELRNPLAPLRNAVAILRIGAKSPQQVNWALEVIDRQTAQMARLMDDLLDVSRIARGKVELKLAPLDLREVLTEVFETLRPSFMASEHGAEIDLPLEPLWIEGDRIRLAQVFSNLLMNAAKYSEHCGYIVLSAKSAGLDAIISVRDEGMGIEAELLERLFEPFAQSQRTRHRAEGGLGIGLALVKGLVELHHGTVCARSEGVGLGAEFVVTLPMLALQVKLAAEPHALRASASLLPESFTMLVVDDNRDAADSLAHLLSGLGAEVVVAYDGFAALRSIEKLRPAIVIMDIGMPGLSGYEVARRVTKENGRPFLIAVSGWGQDSDRAAAIEAGFDLHYTKPVEPNELVQAIENLAVSRGIRAE
jgi:PAS domain S-box-containing protein